VAALVAVV
jgi:hypothetical protein